MDAFHRADADPTDTNAWIESLDTVLHSEGPQRARYLLTRLVEHGLGRGIALPFTANTPYVNTIPAERQPVYPGDRQIERRIRSLIRWNAMAMVVRANRLYSGLGGHISTFASCATLFETGFNHFFRAHNDEVVGDQIYFQGHASPGIYARAFLEGRLSAAHMHAFRREVDGGGLSSYPHPWLMPEFWEFPTVSMGLSPICSIYQARFNRYLRDRGLRDTDASHIWAFIGDGETDEPETLGAITLAAREHLDNLTWVINCNLQRLDGPVRGNGKIIQELEAAFRGAGWNVIKVIWGSYWDPLFMRDKTGILLKRMEECVDGEYQTFKSQDGAFVRKHFFGKYPELLEMVSHMTDDDIWRLNRGGHDPHKIYAAYAAATKHVEQPTVILAKTVKGYGMGEAGEGQNITHQQKKMGTASIRAFRDRFEVPIPDEKLDEVPFYRPPEDSPEMKYLRERIAAMGGSVPARRRKSSPLEVPALSAFEAQLKGTEGREISTTMAFVRVLNTLVRDKTIGKLVVPIVPDESRTFGMEGMFRQLGIYSHVGQLYTPQDADQLMFYKEDKNGQILQEGICEAGAMCSWIAAATSYSTHNQPMIPFYIFYSMFGFQRVGDLAWAAGDMRARGFLLGGTSGRTTLNGEGLQHEDGHSHLIASTIPNCVSYDPTYAYELAVIIQDGLRRMYAQQEDVYYYITVMNENYAHPAMPEGAAEGILRGMHLISASKASKGKLKVQLMGCGSILREVMAAAEMLQKDFGVAADIWSVTSFNELRRDGLEIARWNMLHPEKEPRRSYIEQCLRDHPGPVVAATDYMKVFADQIRAYLPQPALYSVLGTDGFGRSDTRRALRGFFEVDRRYVAVAALKALADQEALPQKKVLEAIRKYGVDPEKPNPARV
ncbi:MAG TPA: pyruvate dehydrogenase (acetyl-transferring), homodimeric type [Burkholderiales bacterium]